MLITSRFPLICIVVLAGFIAVCSCYGQAAPPTGPPPGAIPDVDPAQYVLLKADVPATWSWGNPEANQEAGGTGITTNGRQDTQSWWQMTTEQDIVVPVTGPDGSKRGIPVKIIGTVLKTPEYTKMGWDRWLSSGKLPIGLPEGLADKWAESQCADKFGEETCQGTISGKPAASFSFRYKAYAGHVSAASYELDTPEGIAAARAVAKLLAAKIAGAKLPVFNGLDVAILPDEWSFCVDSYGKEMPVEQAADKQGIVAYVRNLSDKVTAEEIRVQLWLGQPGYEGCQAVGAPVTINNLQPHHFQKVNLIWPLPGNVEKAPLYVQALPTRQEDVDPENNATGASVSIYYAHNGNRAYSLPQDAYSFVNFSLEPDDAEGAVEEWLAGILGQSTSDPKLLEVMQRIIFPQTFANFMNYTKASAEAGAGGHCYGMSATSAEYFLGNLARPGSAASTAALSQSQASYNINLYHRAQMRSAMEAALGGQNWHPREEGIQKTVDALRASLRDQRKPLIIEFFGKQAIPGQPGKFSYPGHAILGYKMVDWGEGKYCVYLYDSNFPLGNIVGKSVPFFTFKPDAGTFSFPSYVPYMWAIPSWVSAQPLTRTISTTVMNTLVPQIKQALADTANLLASANSVMAVLRCPADALITDSQGNAIGLKSGKTVNTIPGAKVISDKGAEIYLLPAGHSYSVSVARKGQGDIGFDLLHAEPGGKVGVVSYDKLPIGPTGGAKVTLAADGKTTAEVNGKAIAPTLSGISEGGRISATTPTTTSPTTTNRQPAVLFDNSNIAGVLNRPTAPTRVVLTTACRITAVETYHWNNGRGATPGKVGLRLASGNFRQEWQAGGLDGMGGRKNCTWHADVDTIVPAGTYLVTDSDPATWSQNQESGGAGIAKVWGIAATRQTTPSGTQSTQTTAPAASAPAQSGSLVICTAVVNNKPVNPATQFTNVPRLYCWLPYEGLAAGVTVTCEWLRGGQSYATSKTTVGGAKGWIWFNVSSNADTLAKGNYTVKVSAPNRVLGQQDFVVN